MRHAYLIIAHNEFEHLQRLINVLDDARNDIYVHIDKKVKHAPHLTASNSRLVILKDRVDVCWGHISQIKAEYALFEAAKNGGEYEFYHLISGAHFPLKNQDETHAYFDNAGTSVLNHMNCDTDEMATKLGKYHFFLRGMKSRSSWMRKISRLLWRGCSRIQRHMKRRDYSYFHEKCSQWLSLTDEAVNTVINDKRYILQKLRFTFCPDEIAIPAILHKNRIDYLSTTDLLYTDFDCASPRLMTVNDLSDMMNSGALFARKFGNESKEISNLITEQWPQDTHI
ncbi:MAG: glycosyl transferase [Bacteroides sp.]|nr:glycosyl transferase [Bacteroides sp.]MCM1413238.1 glycosyl transferase [Bacteroides sp.]MCM1471452.1 glycosyl transferase [Bacteroides sp.]